MITDSEQDYSENSKQGQNIAAWKSRQCPVMDGYENQLVNEKERSLLITQAEKVHLLATTLQKEFPISPGQYSAKFPIVSPKPRSRIIRFIQTLLFPIFLVMASGVVLLVVGDKGLSSFNAFISKYWPIASIFRLIIYIVLSWIVLPKLLMQIKRQKLLELHYLYEEVKQDPLCDLENLWEIENRMQNVAQSGISSWLCFIILITFDFIAIQLPFLLK